MEQEKIKVTKEEKKVIIEGLKKKFRKAYFESREFAYDIGTISGIATTCLGFAIGNALTNGAGLKVFLKQAMLSPVVTGSATVILNERRIAQLAKQAFDQYYEVIK